MTDITPNYTPEEIEKAKQDLSAMKPEDLLSLQTQLEIAQDAALLSEAPAIAFMELRAPSGAKINLTCRASSGQLVLDALAATVAYARERYSMSTTGTPSTSTPMPMISESAQQEQKDNQEQGIQTIPAQPQLMTINPTVEIQVTSIMRERKRDGKGDFLRVRGGKFVKFGVPCYPEKFPQGLNVTALQYGIENTNIPQSMRVALVSDIKPYHVISFHG